jgi:hypothetical protein
MKARPSDWITFSLALVGSIIAIVGAAGLLNLIGDCPAEVTDCGEPQRRASFVVLGLGVLWIVYLIIRFIRSPRKFR